MHQTTKGLDSCVMQWYYSKSAVYRKCYTGDAVTMSQVAAVQFQLIWKIHHKLSTKVGQCDAIMFLSYFVCVVFVSTQRYCRCTSVCSIYLYSVKIILCPVSYFRSSQLSSPWVHLNCKNKPSKHPWSQLTVAFLEVYCVLVVFITTFIQH